MQFDIILQLSYWHYLNFNLIQSNSSLLGAKVETQLIAPKSAWSRRTCEEAGQLQRAVPAAGRGVLQHVGPDDVRLLRGAPGGVVRD